MTGRQQLARLLPLALLLVLAIGGLRGEIAVAGWDGPLKARGLEIGLILEAVLVVLLVITLARDRAARQTGGPEPERVRDGPDVPASLRLVLSWVLAGGVLAVGGVLLASLAGSRTFTPRGGRYAPRRLGGPPKPPRHQVSPGTAHIPIEAILYGLLLAALIVAIAASIWWSSRLRRPAAARPEGTLAVDTEDLRDAIEVGRAALAELDDARAAIIACYVAMERSLADRGAARNAADTPDELLARAVAAGIAAGPAARALTGLFYEARFSTHPVGREKRDAARRALDDLAGDLAADLAAGRASGRASGDAPGEASGQETAS